MQRRETLLVMAIMAVPAVLTGFAAFSSLRAPADDRMAAGFFAHEADFQRLIVMLHSQDSRLLSARGPILASMGATDLQYFPKSGDVVVRTAASDAGFEGVSKTYLYTDAPTKGDYPLRGGWFVHREDAIAGLAAPY